MISILGMLVGASLFGYIIGAVCGIVASIDEATTRFRQRLDDLNRYMKEHELPDEMRVRLRRYFLTSRELLRQRHYQGLLQARTHADMHSRMLHARLRAEQAMSPSLRREVAWFTNSEWVSKVPFFKCDDEAERADFVAEIALVMVVDMFPPQEQIVRMGEKPTRM